VLSFVLSIAPGYDQQAAIPERQLKRKCSDVGARSQMSNSSSLVRITGIAFDDRTEPAMRLVGTVVGAPEPRQTCCGARFPGEALFARG
jgi:hypothetical protein